MGVLAFQITSLTTVYSTVYSGADQSKHQSCASLAFVWGIHRGPVNSPQKWPVTRKMFPFDDVIMERNLLHVLEPLHPIKCHFTDEISLTNQMLHYDVIKWKQFPRYRPFVSWIPPTKGNNVGLWCPYVVSLCKRLNKHSIDRWFYTPWQAFDVAVMWEIHFTVIRFLAIGYL